MFPFQAFKLWRFQRGFDRVNLRRPTTDHDTAVGAGCVTAAVSVSFLSARALEVTKLAERRTAGAASV